MEKLAKAKKEPHQPSQDTRDRPEKRKWEQDHPLQVYNDDSPWNANRGGRGKGKGKGGKNDKGGKGGKGDGAGRDKSKGTGGEKNLTTVKREQGSSKK